MAWSFYDQNGKVLQGVLAVSIDTTELADDAVTSAKIATDAVIADGIAANAVITAKVLDANVTLAKIASQAANTVLVRDANSSGVVSAKAVADTQLLIGDGTGFTAATLSGDATLANSGAVTITADAVEGSMVHANVVDDTTLEQSGTQFRIKDNGVTLAKMAGGTDGNLITYDTSGDPAYVVTGDDGQVLTSAGANNPPAFETLVAGVGLGLVIALT